MFVLERIYPLKAVQNKILLNRLPINYCKRPLIEADFHREDAGYWGEKALDYYLSFLPEDQYYIFQDLHLKFDKWTFQIDFLLLTTKFALIIEAKNYAGNLHFENKFNQLIQTHNEKEKGYDDPISQVERQQRLLKKWFEKYLTVVFPIDFFVVMSNSNAILSTDSAEIPKKVCKPFKLLSKIEEHESSYQKEKTDLKTLKKICKLLLKHHTPKSFHCLEEYKIPIEDILTGARCPYCNSIPMTYQYGKWYC